MNFVAQSIAAMLLAASQEPAIPALKDSITVIAQSPLNTIENPDPSQRILVREELLDAIPGVAGDHGEPIAQFI